MNIDHIGIAVGSLEEGLRNWNSLFGYSQISPIVTNTRQKTRVVFIGKDNSIPIKLIQPDGASSPLTEFTRKGGGLHHLCFRCENLRDAIPSLKSLGARCLVPPEPGEAFLGHDIAFLLMPGNLNIELIDTDDKVLLPRLTHQLDSGS